MARNRALFSGGNYKLNISFDQWRNWMRERWEVGEQKGQTGKKQQYVQRCKFEK